MVKLRALKGFHPDRGAWHGSGEALDKTLVSLLERGGGGETIRRHAFRGLGAAQLKDMGAPMQTIMLWGGWKTLGVAKMYTEAPPPKWKFVRSGEIPWPAWGGSGEREPGYRVRKGSTLALWPSWVTTKITYAQSEGARHPGGRDATAQGADRKRGRAASPTPRRRGGGVFRSLASEVAAMRGVKSQRREMVRKMIVGMGEAMSSLQGGDEGLKVLTDVLQRVRDGGDLEEEDDGHYSSSDEEGPVTAEMAARGVGEAGCVVVADSIWNRLVPHDLLRVYERARRDRGEEASTPAKRQHARVPAG